MAGLFPDPLNGGVPPGANVPNSYVPVNAPQPTGCGPYYYANDCSTVLGVEAMNAITSELLALVDKLGGSWNCGSLTNMADILVDQFTEISATYVKKSGDTMEGPLILPADAPTDPNAAVNKNYVDSAVAAATDAAEACCDETKEYVDQGLAGKVNRSGDAMTGPLLLSGDPTESNHAATKNYVDHSLTQVGFVEEAPDDGKVYARQSKQWVEQTGGVLVSDTPPPTAMPKQLWWNSTTGDTFIRYDDGDSVQWVQINMYNDTGSLAEMVNSLVARVAALEAK